MENRFLEAEMEFKGISARSGRTSGPRAVATSFATGRSFDWVRSQSAAQRALVILIDNGGIDLGIPDLVDRILSTLPGSSLLPDGVKQKLVDILRAKIKSFTDDLLETAELSANRYTAAKPGLYAEVVILCNGTATYSDLKNQLTSLSRAGRIIDIFVLTHGGPDTIWTADPIRGDNLRQIKAEYGQPLSIRSVYQMNCYGDSLNKAWHDAGARVSCGSTDINYLPEPTMFFFWRAWTNGQSFERAATSAFESAVGMMNDAVRTFLDLMPIAGAGGFDFHSYDFIKGSAPIVVGQKDLTIASDDVSFAQCAFPATATTVIPSNPRSRSMSDADAGAGNAAMTVSGAGVEFVKGWEGFVPKLYNDPVGHCTIGYGTLVHKGNCDGRESERRYLNGVSKEEATRLLVAELAEKQKAVREAIKVPLNQNQYDALVCFAYNVGTGAFRRSTLLKLLNQGKYDEVPLELKKWSKARQDGKLIDLPGLVNRRAAEATLFQTPPAAAAQSLRGLAWGALGRMLSQNGVAVPARHSYCYESPSLASTQSTLSVQQNPVALVAGIEVADAIQIGLAAAGIVQSQVNGAPGAGSFHLFYDKAQRMLTPEARAQMPGAAKAKQRYSHQLFFIGADHPVISDAYASVIIEWGGNIYGEIETPEIRKDQQHSTDWQHSSNDLTITNVARIPAPNTDPRTWPLTYAYEGTFDPVGNGYFEYSGEFEIDAFGGLKFNRHEVVSRSLIDWAIAGKPEQYVRKGQDVVVPVPDIPKEQLDYLRTKLP